MSDPERLLESEQDALIRDALRAGLGDDPGPVRMRQAAAALGLAAGGAALTSSTSAGAAASTSLWSLTKLVGLGMIAGGLSSAALWQLAESPSEQAPSGPSRPAIAAAVAPSAPGKPAPAAAPAPEPEHSEPTSEARSARSPARLPAVEAPASARPAATPSSLAQAAFPSPADDRSALREELRIIDEARRALASGHAEAALAVLDRYRREHPRGVLATEATMVRIEALVRGNRQGEARRLAQGYLRAQPQSPHRERLLRLVGETPSP